MVRVIIKIKENIVMNEELIKALERIASALEDISNSIDNIDQNLGECIYPIGDGNFIGVTGNVSTRDY